MFVKITLLLIIYHMKSHDGISECDTVEKLYYSAGFEPMCAPIIHTFHSIVPVSEVFVATCIKLVPQLLIFNAIINDNDPHTLMVLVS